MTGLFNQIKTDAGFGYLFSQFCDSSPGQNNGGRGYRLVPFEFKQGDKYVGFDIDLWDAIAKKMHISYELRPMDFGGPIPGLQSRNLDVAMAGITITDARKQVGFQ